MKIRKMVGGGMVCVFLLVLQWPLPCLGLDNDSGNDEVLSSTTMTAVIQMKVKRTKAARIHEEVSPRDRMAILIGGSRFAVLPEAKVVDSKGHELTMDSLPVPCEASIVFHPEQFADPGVLRIEVLKVLPTAKTAWPLAVPE